MKSWIRAALAAASLALASGAQAQTTEVSGVKLDNTITVANTKLSLNGAGIRTRFVVKVYVGGLYLPQKAATTDEVLKMAGPKRMHVVMLRDIDAQQLGNLLVRGVEDNSSKEEFYKFATSFTRLSNIFNEKKKLATGETFGVEFQPGVGTLILVNGKPAGEPFKEPEFFNALMRIWLGPKPADAELKRALLGQTKPEPRTSMGDR
jgi:hypothetical protein